MGGGTHAWFGMHARPRRVLPRLISTRPPRPPRSVHSLWYGHEQSTHAQRVEVILGLADACAQVLAALLRILEGALGGGGGLWRAVVGSAAPSQPCDRGWGRHRRQHRDGREGYRHAPSMRPCAPRHRTCSKDAANSCRAESARSLLSLSLYFSCTMRIEPTFFTIPFTAWQYGHSRTFLQRSTTRFRAAALRM